jgi:hypothetical protein
LENLDADVFLKEKDALNESMESPMKKKQKIEEEEPDQDKSKNAPSKMNAMLSKSLIKGLECLICADVMQDAMEVACCGTTFCEGCIKTWMKSKKNCPACRQYLQAKDLRKNIPIQVYIIHAKTFRLHVFPMTNLQSFTYLYL